MNCTNRDQDLLLLAHTELSVAAAMTTLAHIVVCKRCRDRYDKLARTSAAFTQMPGADLTRSRKFLTSSQWVSVGTGIALGILVLILTGAVVGVHAYTEAHQHIADVLCTPGLPNGQCR
jgi:hypothetical protein